MKRSWTFRDSPPDVSSEFTHIERKRSRGGPAKREYHQSCSGLLEVPDYGSLSALRGVQNNTRYPGDELEAEVSDAIDEFKKTF